LAGTARYARYDQRRTALDIVGDGGSSAGETLRQASPAGDRVGCLLGHIAVDIFLVEARFETYDQSPWE
jgi:hypothetical protein